MEDTTDQALMGQDSASEAVQPSPQAYTDALLTSGIQAAKLLTELIDLKLMPDPRAKEMAEVALEVLKLVNDSPVMQNKLDNQSSELE